MFRKPIFWVVFFLIFVGSTFFAFKYFSSAYPVVSLDLRMDRQTALQVAKELANENNWGSEGFRQAASFGLETEVQYFIELEGGGTEVFKKMLAEGQYSPYTWSIRHFKEGETNETLIRFTPKGEPYGFKEKLPEAEPGAALTSDSALIIANISAREKWQIDLSDYKLVEQAQEVRPGGRIDHTIVYERSDMQVGEGHFRLRLVVGGDKLTEFTHFIKIPEAFSRRYEEMRSANDSIAGISVIALIILYVLGGCIIGLFFLLKQRFVIWRQPLFWGFLVAFLQVLASINQWPLAWMGYDTALSAQGFLLKQIAILILTFIGMGSLLSMAFMAAESLTRKAFPHHIQMWRLWSSDVASSPPVLGQTVGGYLMVSIFFAFDIAVYFFASKVLGWWTPSGALFEPDILATYFPWLSSIAISLQAGFFEECLFRAVPIAGAALLGKKFGHRRAWIIGAFILQALIFGAGHANYPQQPSYARVVELFIPALAFGAIYLYFGLLPAIVMHFAVDVVWFAMPLFVSSAPGIWIDQLMVIILTLIPLWVVFYARLKHKAWGLIKDKHLNLAWQPPPKVESETVTAKAAERPKIGSNTIRVLPIAGILALVIWFLSAEFKNSAPTMPVSRNDALELATKTMEARGIELSDSWDQLCCIESPLGDDDRFIWQNGNEEKYSALMGEYLSAPYWKVRYVQFEGDVAKRAEEYQLFISVNNEVARFRHILPEARAGATLSEERARELAYSALKEKYNWEPSALKEISAVPSKLTERTDWIFTFTDTISYPLEEGEARLAVKIAGDMVIDSYRFIHIPEEWTRKERNQENLTQIIRIFSIMITVMLFVAGMVGAIIGWSRKRFSVATFLVFLIMLFGLYVVKAINSWPCTMADFSTTEPFSHQILLLVVLPIVLLLFISIGPALVLGFIHKWQEKAANLKKSTSILIGLSTGAIMAGLSTLVTALFKPSLEPVWAKYNALGNYIPFLADGVGPIATYIMKTIIILLIITAVDRFTKGWTKRKPLFAVLFIFSMLVVSSSGVDSIFFWLLSGLFAGIVYLLTYRFVFRFQPATIPLAVGFMIILSQLKICMYNAYSSAIPGAILSIILIGLLSYYWFIKLQGEE